MDYKDDTARMQLLGMEVQGLASCALHICTTYREQFINSERAHIVEAAERYLADLLKRSTMGPLQ